MLYTIIYAVLNMTSENNGGMAERPWTRIQMASGASVGHFSVDDHLLLISVCVELAVLALMYASINSKKA